MNKGIIHEEAQFEALIHGLINDNYGCCNEFILPSTVIGLMNNIKDLRESGNMIASGIGNANKFKKDELVRGDTINWILQKSINPFEKIYTEKMERFILYLNTTCFTSITSFESHYASYAPNSFYKRHIDQFQNENGRKYSTVLYLNQNWLKSDGGMLSLYPKVGCQINTSPLACRLVFFKSDEMEHEVHTSFTRERNSIAAWLKN